MSRRPVPIWNQKTRLEQPQKSIRRRHCGPALVVLLALWLALPHLLVAQGPNSPETNEELRETVQRLLNQVQQLQSRVSELEARQGANDAADSGLKNAIVAEKTSPPEEEQQQPTETDSGHTMELPGGPQMRIQGFTHMGFEARAPQNGTANSFFLGNFDMFITSRLSDKFSMLAELNFEAGGDNNIGVDLERMLLNYKPNDYFQFGFGRFHTQIGYYNNAYHHGNWFETATVRPFLFLFEDEGGILPVHNVGLTLTGLVPSGKLGLHYIAEIGNGRPARHPQNTTVQNAFDESNGKAFNFAAYVRPDWLRGLQAGASIYHDHLIPDVPPRIQENIASAYIVYINSRFEFLNEAVLIRHSFDNTSRVLNMPGFYSQIGKQWGPVRPYFRYQYVNTSPLDPVIGDAGRMHGPSAGIRYDWSEYAAFKLQYDRNFIRAASSENNVTGLMSFTF